MWIKKSRTGCDGLFSLPLLDSCCCVSVDSLASDAYGQDWTQWERHEIPAPWVEVCLELARN